MKKLMHAFLLMLSLVSIQSASAWTLYVTNWVNKPVNIHTSWAGSGWFLGKCFSCCDDHATIQPGQRISINARECLLKELRVDGGTSYTSSGQRKYNEFYIIGPVDGQLRAGRIGRNYSEMDITGTGNRGALFNASSYPATDVKIEIYSKKDTTTRLVTTSSIPAGQDFVFDLSPVPGDYIGTIELTLNNKIIMKYPTEHVIAHKKMVHLSRLFFISGPPDGSNPQIIKLIQ